jgi:hypothetical protein
MPTHTQLQKIWLLSDTVLYSEAVAFMRRLVRDQGCNPLPAAQVNGLFSIAESQLYDKLYAFVVHQRDRDWQPSKRDIKTFYTALEETLTNMQKRLRSDFHLLGGSRKPGGQDEADEQELMALLAREFIQHLLAENGLLSIRAEEERQQRQRNQQAGRYQQQTGPAHHSPHRKTGGRYGN